MSRFLSELYKRNKKLFFFGLLNFIAVIVCMGLTQNDDTIILGINAWIKPMKFFMSIGILSWSMAWYLYYLKKKRAANIYSWVLIITMVIEMTIICTQSARGIRSHFNFSSTLNTTLFNIMGGAIGLFTVWTGYICYLFFKQKEFNLPIIYVWGIRIGMLFFIIFALEAGFMLHNMGHTVGGIDGGPGLPLLNWSTFHGDLRVAHFFGMHSLQIIPLFSYYITTRKREFIFFSLLYFLIVVVFLVMAMRGIPLYNID